MYAILKHIHTQYIHITFFTRVKYFQFHVTSITKLPEGKSFSNDLNKLCYNFLRGDISNGEGLTILTDSPYGNGLKFNIEREQVLRMYFAKERTIPSTFSPMVKGPMVKIKSDGVCTRPTYDISEGISNSCVGHDKRYVKTREMPAESRANFGNKAELIFRDFVELNLDNFLRLSSPVT